MPDPSSGVVEGERDLKKTLVAELTTSPVSQP